MAGLHITAGQILPEAGLFLKLRDRIFTGIHEEDGFPGTLYHALVGMGMVSLTVSGLWINFRLPQPMKKS